MTTARRLIDRLRIERKRQGIRQTELAARIGISQGDISRMERREDQLLSSFLRMSHALGFQVVLQPIKQNKDQEKDD